MKQLNDKIITWLKQHGIDKLSPDKQYLKIIEEVGELAKGLLYEKHNEIKDAIGDIYVALVGWYLQSDLDLIFYNNNNYVELNDISNIADILDSLSLINQRSGYILIRLSLIANNNNLSFKECVEHAYNEIKDRDIKIKKGVAVK